MKVNVYEVNMKVIGVVVSEREFNDYEEMFNFIIEKCGEIDVDGVNIKKEQYGEEEIIVQYDEYNFIQVDLID